MPKDSGVILVTLHFERVQKVLFPTSLARIHAGKRNRNVESCNAAQSERFQDYACFPGSTLGCLSRYWTF